MHTILVPLDGSNHALKALRIACDLAEKYDGRLALLHVLDPRKTTKDLLALDLAATFGSQLRASLEADTSQPSHETLRRVGQAIMNDAARRVTQRGVDAEMLELEAGDPVESILIARERTGAGTIVMGCRGTGASPAGTLGSVSGTVFERADCTCISVK